MNIKKKKRGGKNQAEKNVAVSPLEKINSLTLKGGGEAREAFGRQVPKSSGEKKRGLGTRGGGGESAGDTVRVPRRGSIFEGYSWDDKKEVFGTTQGQELTGLKKIGGREIHRTIPCNGNERGRKSTTGRVVKDASRI